MSHAEMEMMARAISSVALAIEGAGNAITQAIREHTEALQRLAEGDFDLDDPQDFGDGHGG